MSEQTRQKHEYTLAAGQVLRDGTPVANYNVEAGALDFLSGLERYRAPVVRLLNQLGLPIAPSIPVVNPEHTETAAAPIPAVVGAGEDIVTIKAKVYPDAPKCDPMAGDKDPVFVEWLRDNHPADYAVRFAGRRTHLS